MVDVNLTIADGRTSFYQWDTDVYLLVEGVVAGNELHFDMPNTDVPYEVKIEQDEDRVVCRVPDELLQTVGSFKVWVYVTDDLGTRTTFQKKFRVTKREKPADYIYTETERETLDTLTERVDNLADALYDLKDSIDESINETVEELKASQVKSVNGVFPDENQNIQLNIEAVVLKTLEKVGTVELVYADDGSVYTDENGSILLF